MENKEIEELALLHGFADAKVIGTDKIVFCLEFRKYCEENLCGEYGNNYSCPPDCGSADQMKKRALSFTKALVVRSTCLVTDLSDTKAIKEAKLFHNGAMLSLINNLKNVDNREGIMAGASGCMICNTCSRLESKPCAHPHLRYSCLSAYCINVMALAQECGMDYTYKDGELSFFGAYFYN